MDNSEWVMPVHIIAAAGIVVNGKNEILLVRNPRRGWEFPGGQVEAGENLIDAVKREILEETGYAVEVGEVFCISSNTCKYPGYNGVKEIPTKIILDFICHTRGEPAKASEEDLETAFIPRDKVLEMIRAKAYIERYKAFLEYTGRPVYLEYKSKPEFQLLLKRLI